MLIGATISESGVTFKIYWPERANRVFSGHPNSLPRLQMEQKVSTSSAGALSGSTDSATRVDPVTASIIQGALENIAVEMGYKLMRMAYSSIIRESEDFGAAICDARGRQLCECSMSTPLQSGPIPGYVKGILREFERRGETFKPGDVIIHNDPYNGASHSPDIGFCVPIFLAGELVGFSVTTAHHLDIGSSQPGSVGVVVCADAYAEGIRLRALKVVEEGKRNETAWRLIEDNVRVAHLVLGDMEAQIAACHVGAKRFLELVERYSLPVLTGAVDDLFDYSERLMRQEIEKIPDGTYSATGHIDGFLGAGDPALENLPICVTVTVKGSDLTVDLAGTAPQVDGHAINMPFVGTVDVALWLTLRSILLDSDVMGNIPQNDGLFRPIHIVAPRGCIANPIFPAPTIARFAPGNIIADTLMKALAPAVPEKICAGVANLKAITFTGFSGENQWVHIEIFEGSYGGRHGKDGMDSVDTLYANTRNNPIEDIESHVPLRVTRYEFREDACGAGRWRGGWNSVKQVEFLTDGALSVEGDGHANAPWGFAGGSAGQPSSLELITRDGVLKTLPSMLPTISVSRGDKVCAVGGIGGGYGDPFSRAEEAVLNDVLDGYLTAEDAVNRFGVVIQQGRVNLAATRRIRQGAE
jgi:N-methylhydantoinase B